MLLEKHGSHAKGHFTGFSAHADRSCSSQLSSTLAFNFKIEMEIDQSVSQSIHQSLIHKKDPTFANPIDFVHDYPSGK